ncbi:polysaccharide deacetylase family protein [Colwellia sp. MSW7]|uniref:Polysaccharide deacetylase family protein n=1 Tax=Colwellia maritima TaxID=2912588 RepID=A0ABS9WWI9_9GAMM|nr:polysaccharide deacetylase family protein [Colwellia maritima]MCI2282235.1 polysaccharide deacetylase family protein [Colwellia maritima]
MGIFSQMLISNPLLWHSKPNGLYCFNYHRIGDPNSTLYDPNVYSCNEEVFEKHIQFYKSNFDVISIEELETLSKTTTKFNNKFAIISFDDGYIDNYELAYPILKSYKTPAIFFIATDFIDKEILPWWDEIAFLVKKSDQDTIRLSGWNKSLSISSLNKCGVIKNVLQTIKIDSTKTMHEKIVLLKVALGIEKDFITPHENLFVNWDMLREMKKNGMSIGSQSCSHHIMSHLSTNEQQHEADNSKRRINTELSDNISSFAYPVGGKDAFTLETEKILANTGYSFGFSFIPGINRRLGVNKYHLNRFSIDNNCSVNQIKKQINKAIIKFI